MAILFLQVFLSSLDLIGVALFGVLAALAVNGLQGNQNGDRISRVLDFIHLEDFGYTAQFLILSVLCSLLFIAKTLSSLFITKRIINFFSNRSAMLANKLFSFVLKEELFVNRKNSSQEFLYLIASSSKGIMSGVLSTAMFLVSDIILMTVLSLALLVISPVMFLTFLGLFGIIGAYLYQKLKAKASFLGERGAILSIKLGEGILGAIKSFREIYVKGQEGNFSNSISRINRETASISAETSFMPNIGKYVIEIAMVITILILSLSQYFSADSSQAVGSLALFLAAGSRIAPAVLRVQQSSITIKTAKQVAIPALSVLETKKFAHQESLEVRKFKDIFEGFSPTVIVRNLTFSHLGKATKVLENVSLHINSGENIAIVGSSGAGKSSLVDCLLGINTPTSGEVTISGVTPREAIKKWPGAIAYVPQEVFIEDSNIRKNITYGFDGQDVPEAKVLRAANMAQLSSFIESLPDGLDTQVGEGGSLLSGGERQRIGIARALLTNPKLIVLDESTSSLDGETESQLTTVLGQLRGRTTVISIAHRLSSVRMADLVVFLDRGEVVAIGSFDEVRAQAPDFDRQARLMGL